MSATAPHVARTLIDVSLAAIFVSPELSRSPWLVTSLSPGDGEKMSKRSVGSGDVAGFLDHAAKLRAKAQARTGKTFPVIAIYEVGLDGFWLRRVLEAGGY
jgi:transposase